MSSIRKQGKEAAIKITKEQITAAIAKAEETAMTVVNKSGGIQAGGGERKSTGGEVRVETTVDDRGSDTDPPTAKNLFRNSRSSTNRLPSIAKIVFGGSSNKEGSATPNRSNSRRMYTHRGTSTRMPQGSSRMMEVQGNDELQSSHHQL